MGFNEEIQEKKEELESQISNINSYIDQIIDLWEDDHGLLPGVLRDLDSIGEILAQAIEKIKEV